MNKVTRRVFLRRASLGVAAVGVATTVPGFLRGSVKPTTKTSPNSARPLATVAQEGPLVAHIQDVSSGQITLMIGSREVTYQNREMANQLLLAAQ
ncbi:MAG: hypothetical protein M0027_09490 [Candidatus Dormibacteraeota bacterium]|nr:hypothetical protein [Candidatus Dormibacteraeota bacterium]